MDDRDDIADSPEPLAVPLVVVVTGMSGAGRTTAISALEDLGYEALDNFPLSLFESLIEPGTGTSAPLAIGIHSRTRGFSTRALTETMDRLRRRWRAGAALVFLDCSDAVLLSRFSQTRRRHPLAPAEDVSTGIARERDVLRAVREDADAVIDTTTMSPHALRAELVARFSLDRSAGLSVTVQSFAYKRGTPHGADMVLDCRFLRNPYWDETLRALDGRDQRIQSFVMGDLLYEPFFEKLQDMVTTLLPAYRDEGKAHFTIALGCTGGRHRSVTVAEMLSRQLAQDGWTVSIRHSELEPGGRILT
ncbi:MAG: RNase adapter RapZ [Pseudomonadota bacterium]